MPTSSPTERPELMIEEVITCHYLAAYIQMEASSTRLKSRDDNQIPVQMKEEAGGWRKGKENSENPGTPYAIDDCRRPTRAKGVIKS